MTEEDDIESLWSDLRPPRRRPEPQPEPVEDPFSWADRFDNSVGIRRALEGLDDRLNVSVEIALFTPNGEVIATDYRRVRSFLTITNRRLLLGAVQFPSAQESWGFVLTLGICPVGTEADPQPAPAFYSDLPTGQLVVSTVQVTQGTTALFEFNTSPK